MTKEALEQAREEILKDENASTDEGERERPRESSAAASGALEKPRAKRRTEIEIVDASPNTSRVHLATSVDELPDVLTTAEWRELEPRIIADTRSKNFRLSGELAFDFTAGTTARSASIQPHVGGETAGGDVRPTRIEDIVGQTRVVSNLRRLAAATRGRSEALGHVLLSGPPGVGKTTIASVVAAELGVGFVSTHGGIIDGPAALLSLLAGLGARDVLFVDEVHGLSTRCMEFLYTALENRYVDLQLGSVRGGRVRSIRLEFEPFTFVAATTSAGALTDALRSRFHLADSLEPYSIEEIAEIVRRAGERIGAHVGGEATIELARRSRERPREAIRLLRLTRDFAGGDGAHVGGGGGVTIDAEAVRRTASEFGIDADGLGPDDRRILDALHSRGRAIGIGALAQVTSIDRETIENVHEPYLLRLGFVERSPCGRSLTADGRRRVLVAKARSSALVATG